MIAAQCHSPWSPSAGTGWRFQAEPSDRAFFLWRRWGAEAATDRGKTHSPRRDEKLARLEAALFVAPEALSTRRLAQVALLADAAEARTLIDRLNTVYDQSETAFRVERVAAGYRLMARPVFSRWLQRLHQRESQLQLSPPALETLTIIAYRQPITRADIELIRGVKSAEMIKQLLERGLVKIGGEEDTLGRPYLYVTTRQFLQLFGLRTLDDLPHAEDLRIPQSEINQEERDAEQGESPAEASASRAEESAETQPGGFAGC